MLKSNEYFDGNVKSISLATEDGPATVGVIAPGEYEFGTTTYEYMTPLSASLDVLFHDADEWVKVEGMETFEVEPDVKFKVRATADVAYICLYTEEALPAFDDGDDCSCDDHCSCH